VGRVVWCALVCYVCCSLQDSRLNYIEQHAGRLGLDAGRLEGARFSAAKASPMGEALDAASSYVDAAALGGLFRCYRAAALLVLLTVPCVMLACTGTTCAGCSMHMSRQLGDAHGS
jgi:hypothetical protein